MSRSLLGEAPDRGTVSGAEGSGQPVVPGVQQAELSFFVYSWFVWVLFFKLFILRTSLFRVIGSNIFFNIVPEIRNCC